MDAVDSSIHVKLLGHRQFMKVVGNLMGLATALTTVTPTYFWGKILDVLIAVNGARRRGRESFGYRNNRSGGGFGSS